MSENIKPTIITSWDSMPPEVSANGEVFSTRVLAAKYMRMEKALKELKEYQPYNSWLNSVIDQALK